MRVLALAAIALTPASALAETGFTLTFPANPSTGYHWVFNPEKSTGSELVTIEDKGHGPPESNLIGAPAPALIGVTCTGTGPVHLVFDYISPDGSTIGETRAVDLECR